MDLSYTQNHRGLPPRRSPSRGRRAARYIDIGGGHPVADNVSFWFYERGWQGIVVEPQPALAGLYARLRPRDIVVAALVGRTTATSTSMLVDRLHGLSTTLEQHARKAEAFGAGYRDRAAAGDDAGHAVRNAMRDLVRDIDFLKVDVEGAEADVLAGGDWQAVPPQGRRGRSGARRIGRAGLGGLGAVSAGAGLPLCAVRYAQPVLRRAGASRRSWPPAVRTGALGQGRHMYEIGRAPENPQPSRSRAGDAIWRAASGRAALARPRLIVAHPGACRARAADSARRSPPPQHRGVPLALGRIACGYDGGQMVEE